MPPAKGSVLEGTFRKVTFGFDHMLLLRKENDYSGKICVRTSGHNPIRIRWISLSKAYSPAYLLQQDAARQQVLPAMSTCHSAAVELLIGAVWEFPGRSLKQSCAALPRLSYYCGAFRTNLARDLLLGSHHGYKHGVDSGGVSRLQDASREYVRCGIRTGPYTRMEKRAERA